MTDEAPNPEDLPPPIPDAELPEEELAQLVDEGRVNEIEGVLREQRVRLPSVLAQVDRVLDAGLGNLATSLVTMLIARFHVAQASRLAERVLAHKDTTGGDELADLAAALMNQERLITAAKVLDAAHERDPHHDRAAYLSARLAARRGDMNAAFESIAKTNPKLLQGSGLLYQARYALLAGRNKAYEKAKKLASKSVEAKEVSAVVGALANRLSLSGVDPTNPMSLRTAMAIEYGSVLVEVAKDDADGGRFGMDPMGLADVGKLVDRIIASVRALGLPIESLFHATEDGEIIAAAIAERIDKPYFEWSATRQVKEGDWLVMASAGTHPHIENRAVRTLHDALEEGTLRSMALILPCGWRGPIVPDVVGRITGDDELPWAIDDEVDETVELIFDERETSNEDAKADVDVLDRHIERFGGIFRATQPAPRAGHVPFLDETPVPRAK